MATERLSIDWTDLPASRDVNATDFAFGAVPSDPSHIIFRGDLVPARGEVFPTGEPIRLGCLPAGAWHDDTPQAPEANLCGRSVHIGAVTRDGYPYLGKMEISPSGQLTAWCGVPTKWLYLNGVIVSA